MAYTRFDPQRETWSVFWRQMNGRKAHRRFRSEEEAQAFKAAITDERPNLNLPRTTLSSDEYVQDGNGCWIWQGSCDDKGYGRARRSGKTMGAHRFSWIVANGPIPAGLEVDHICFVPACINPDHLQLLTRSENAARQRTAISNVCRRGHAFTPENTATSGGGRRCRTCRRAAAEARKRAAKGLEHPTPRREVIIPADLMERMAFAHPGADIVLAADRAFLELDGITYVSILAAVA